MTIVVGFVPTPAGRAALAAAVAEAHLRGSDLIVVNASSGDALADPALASADDLQQVEQRLAAEGLAHEVRTPRGRRDASEEIVDIAEEVDAELVVIGVRRRTAVGKMITGSNAQRILFDAPCPVLCVKGA